MTEETKTDNLPARRDPRDVISGDKIHNIIPQDFASVYRFAELIAASKFAPKDMQEPATIAVAIMHGFEVGLTPMMALQSIAVINGRPSVWGDGALALIVSSDYFEDIEEFFEGTYGQNDFTAVCIVKRKGRPKAVRSEFSWQEAADAQLLNKSGPWTQYRRRMFKMRARAFALRDLFPDVLRGLAIAEEMQDVSPKNGDAPASTEPPAPDTDGEEIKKVTQEVKPARAKREPKPKDKAGDDKKEEVEDATIVDSDGREIVDAQTGEITEAGDAGTTAAQSADTASSPNPPAPDDDGDTEQTEVDPKAEFKKKIEEAKTATAAMKSLMPTLPEGTHKTVVEWFEKHNREWHKAKTMDELKVLWGARATIALQDDELQLSKDMRDNHKARIDREITAAAEKQSPPAPDGAEIDFPAFLVEFQKNLSAAKTPDDVNRLASDLQAEPLKGVLSADEQELLRGLVLDRLDAIESFDK